MKFGRLPRARNPRVPHYSALVAGRRLQLAAAPAEADYSVNMPASLGAMLNDSLGDCVVGDTLATAPGLLKAYRALYDGPIVSVKTRAGKRLRTTRNHAVLTSRGFVPARSLQVGDDVIGTDIPQAVSRGMDDHLNYAPARIQNVFESHQRGRLSGEIKRQVSRAVDFHSDARCFKSEIDIVDTDRFLQDRDVPTSREPEREERFAHAGRATIALNGLRASQTHPRSIFGATPRRVSFGGLRAPLIRSELLRTKPTRLSHRAHFHASPAHSSIQPLSADVELTRELLDRFPGNVAPDRIVEIEESCVSEHVYDLSTARNWYVANGIVAHNCTCAGAGHSRQVWTFNANPPMVTAPDSAIEALYEGACGYVPGNPSTDQGGVEQDVLTYWMNKGFDGQELTAFVEIDPTNLGDVRQALYDCGGVYIGFSVPAFLEQNGMAAGSVWDVEPGGDQSIVGGHCVVLPGYNTPAATFKVISWGSLYTMTAAFFAAFVDEVYGLVDSDWIKATGLTPAGLSIAQWQQQMAALQAPGT